MHMYSMRIQGRFVFNMNCPSVCRFIYSFSYIAHGPYLKVGENEDLYFINMHNLYTFISTSHPKLVLLFFVKTTSYHFPFHSFEYDSIYVRIQRIRVMHSKELVIQNFYFFFL